MTNYLMFEESELDIVDDNSNPRQKITKDDVESLRTVIANCGRNPKDVIEKIDKKLKSKQYVGLIQAENCSLEILPKIDNISGDKDAQIRQRLIHMIFVVNDLDVDDQIPSAMGAQSHSLLEILIRKFADKLAIALTYGLPKMYVRHEGDLTKFRGALNVSRQFSVHAVNPSRLACRYNRYSTDIKLNQIIKITVDFLMKKSTNLDNMILLKELAVRFSDVSSISLSQIKWESITIDRTNKRWEELLKFSKLFLSEYFQNTSRGEIYGYPLLFKMNDLFEKYIGRIVLNTYRKGNVTLNKKDIYCIYRDDENRIEQQFRTKPDIVIKINGKVVHIIDTKWKKYSAKEGAENYGTTISDVYQMITYSTIYDSPKVTLLYPHNSDLNKPSGFQISKFITNTNDKKFQVFTFDLKSIDSEFDSEKNQIEKLLSEHEPT